MADGKSGYKGFTEARARANKKYMSNFVEIKVRVTPEKRTAIQDHAQAMGESATTFINRAIDNQILHDGRKSPQEAAGEGLPEFVTRAVSETAERDRLSRDS